MEEILASIRRIIADDGDVTAAQIAEVRQASQAEMPEAPRAAEPAYDDVMAAFETADPAARASPQPEGSALPRSELDIEVADVLFSEPSAVPPPSSPAAAPAASSATDPLAAAPFEPSAPLEPLISSEATATVGQAFNVLSHTVLSRNARTLEDLVKDMLKPMLKVWLDDNLPPLVERLVRSEIERVARGRN